MKKILIYINAGFFLVATALILGGVGYAVDWVKLPSDPILFLSRPWTLITYMFLHVDIWHLFFNMVMLWWMADLFVYAFTVRHFRGMYVFGGLVGGAMYLLAGLLFPDNTGLYLVGSSASILAVAVAAAVRMPEMRLRLFLFGEARLRTVVIVLVVLVVAMAGGNVGEQFAHVGGALAGWLFARGLERGRDYTAWINVVCDFFCSLKIPRVDLKRKPNRRKYKFAGQKATSGRQADYDFNARRKEHDEEIDRILDKIKSNGYEGLTDEEKKTLFDSSRR